MQDRFLFRGKVDNSTGWAYGSLIYFQDDDVYSIAQYVPKLQQTIPVKIITESIGQCTGLKDKNSRLVFEGDVIKYQDSEFDDPILYKVFFEQSMLCWYFETLDKREYYGVGLSIPYSENIEIIGNIHDSSQTEI